MRFIDFHGKTLLVFLSVLLLAAGTVQAYPSGGTSVQDTSLRQSLEFGKGESASIVLPEGWEMVFPQRRCVTYQSKISLCSDTVVPGGMNTCQWIEAAARFIDAPRDEDTVVETTPIAPEMLVFMGASGGCSGQIISPRLKVAFYRIVLQVEEKYYTLVTQPIVWGKDLDKDSVSLFEADLDLIKAGLSFKSYAESTRTEPEPVAEPVVEAPAEVEPVIEEPVAEAPAEVEPVIEEPVAEAPAEVEPVIEEPVIEKPIVEKSPEDKHSIEEVLARLHAEKAPVEEKSSIEKAVVEEPVIKKTFDEATNRPDFRSIKDRIVYFKPYMRSEFLLEADQLRLKGRLSEASEKYEALIASFTYESLVGLGDVSFAMENYESAAMYYNQAIDEAPERPDAYNGLGSIELMRGNLKDAEEIYNIALERDPENPSTFANLGWLTFNRDQLIEAETYFMHSLARKPDPDAAAASVNGLTEISFLYGEYRAAVAWNISFLQKFSDYPEAHANLLRAYLKQDKIKLAVQEAEILEGLLPDAPGTHILAGRAYYAAGLYFKAVEKLCPYVDSSTVVLSAEEITQCAESLGKIGELDSSFDVLRNAVMSPSAAPEHFVQLSKQLEAAGRNEEAVETLRDGLQRFPGHKTIQDVLDRR